MPKWVRAILLVVVSFLVVGGGLLAAFIASQPTSYRITRTARIGCTPAALEPKLTDLRAIDGWMQHVDDPHEAPTVTFSPVTTGAGAWVERKDSRSVGRVELESVGPGAVRLASTTAGSLGTGRSTMELSWDEVEGGVEVELAVSGSLEGVRRALWPVADLERRVGQTLDESLRSLRSACP